jgi:RNA-splicing ligase RtcB
LCNGLGNSDSNYSCAHGCGRNYSRGEVDKSNKQLKEFEKIMKDVITVDINKDTLDEAPFAYKDSDMIIDSIKDNVTIIKRMNAVMNIFVVCDFKIMIYDNHLIIPYDAIHTLFVIL